MVTNKELLELPFAHRLSEKSLNELKAQALKHRFKSKKNLISKGDIVNGAYIVTKGRLRIYNIDPDGKQSSIYYVQEGEACLFAINCVFSDLVYPAWVSTDTSSCAVTLIPGKLFKKLNETEKCVSQFTFNTLSSRIFDLMSRLEEISSMTIGQRVASFLVKHANSKNFVPVTHQEIALQLGTAREVISRILKNLERQKMLKLSRGCVYLIEMKKLANNEFN